MNVNNSSYVDDKDRLSVPSGSSSYARRTSSSSSTSSFNSHRAIDVNSNVIRIVVSSDEPPIRELRHQPIGGSIQVASSDEPPIRELHHQPIGGSIKVASTHEPIRDFRLQPGGGTTGLASTHESIRELRHQPIGGTIGLTSTHEPITNDWHTSTGNYSQPLPGTTTSGDAIRVTDDVDEVFLPESSGLLISVPNSSRSVETPSWNSHRHTNQNTDLISVNSNFEEEIPDNTPVHLDHEFELPPLLNLTYRTGRNRPSTSLLGTPTNLDQDRLSTNASHSRDYNDEFDIMSTVFREIEGELDEHNVENEEVDSSNENDYFRCESQDTLEFRGATKIFCAAKNFQRRQSEPSNSYKNSTRAKRSRYSIKKRSSVTPEHLNLPVETPSDESPPAALRQPSTVRVSRSSNRNSSHRLSARPLSRTQSLQGRPTTTFNRRPQTTNVCRDKSPPQLLPPTKWTTLDCLHFPPSGPDCAPGCGYSGLPCYVCSAKQITRANKQREAQNGGTDIENRSSIWTIFGNRRNTSNNAQLPTCALPRILRNRRYNGSPPSYGLLFPGTILQDCWSKFTDIILLRRCCCCDITCLKNAICLLNK